MERTSSSQATREHEPWASLSMCLFNSTVVERQAGRLSKGDDCMRRFAKEANWLAVEVVSFFKHAET